MSMFNDALGALSGAEWEEVPVEIEEFVTSKDFLDLPPLSEYQYQIVRASSQIYRLETLTALYGELSGTERYRQTCNEVVLQLGKGSGKDFTSTVACCYIVYLLLCLKDPARYYGKPRGDAIDILNIAINSDQAKNVFFKGIKEKITSSPWFYGKYEIKNNAIEFIKSVTVYSGHSEREAFEGLNLFVAILDEISGFALESNTGNERANTADATYQMYRASVDSRFPDYGKVLLLSFPRFKGDYIQQRYDGDPMADPPIIGAVAEKEVVLREHTFKIDPELPDGTDGNEFSIEWEEDHILRYSYPRLFALKRPTWEVNPLRNIEDFTRSFMTNKADALGRFACMPSDSTDSTFFKNKQAITDSFRLTNGVDQDGIFHANFKPIMNKEYYVHVDLSKVHDRCAVALAHVDRWVTTEMEYMRESYPMVHVDAIRWWKPSREKPMDYKDVQEYIISLKRKGFNVKLVTFDRWQSHDIMNYLESVGISTETLSVANKHYDDFLSLMYDDRLAGPNIPELIDELKQLRYIKGKVDHPRTGYKDISDAACGAIYNAVFHTKKPQSSIVEVRTYSDLRKEMIEKERENQEKYSTTPTRRSHMPSELKDFLSKFHTI